MHANISENLNLKSEFHASLHFPCQWLWPLCLFIIFFFLRNAQTFSTFQEILKEILSWNSILPMQDIRLTCYHRDISVAELGSIWIADFTGICSRRIFVALMKTLHGARVSCDFSVVSVWGVELLSIFVPSHKHFWRSIKGALKPQLLPHRDGDVLQFCHETSRFWEEQYFD